MKIEWLVTKVTAVRCPDRAELAILGVILDVFNNSGRFCGQGATLWCRTPLVNSKNFTSGSFIGNRVVGN